MNTPTATLQASDLATGDLMLCGDRFREVLDVQPRSEDLTTGEPTEYYVTVGGRDRSRRLTLTADMTVLIRDRSIGGTIDVTVRRDQGRDVQPDDFTLSISLGNAEMKTGEHVAEAVRTVAQDLADGSTDGNVFDVNGNRVGSWTLALPDQADPADVCTCGEPRELHGDDGSCPDGNGEFEMGRPA